MGNQSAKGLLVALVALLLLNSAPRFSMSSVREQTTPQGRVVGITSALRGDTLFLFRTFEDGRTEAMSAQFDINPVERGGPLVLKPAEPWSPLKAKDTDRKPK
jgi:hypothetical protein